VEKVIRGSYKVNKAKVVASCKYYSSYYELNIWFDDTDPKTRGVTYNIGMYEIKEKAGVKRGDGFKKIQAFLDTDEGKEWIGNKLKEQDLRVEIDRIKDSIRVSIVSMSLSDLVEFDRLGKELIKNHSDFVI
jgi:hypothetical protein